MLQARLYRAEARSLAASQAIALDDDVLHAMLDRKLRRLGTTLRHAATELDTARAQLMMLRETTR